MKDHNRLIVALDVNNQGRALELVDMLKDTAGMFKVGMELFYGSGSEVVERIKLKGCKVFLDLKLHDIPNTVARAARVLTGISPDIINVHASGGPEMMREAVLAVREEAQRLGITPPMVIAVTVLTSINREIMNNLGTGGDVEQQVVRLASLARNCGLDGVVASPMEVTPIRKACGEDFVIITPGVRPEGADIGDQKRVMTPSGAVSAGATYVVVGRPITASVSPLEAASKILEQIKGCVK